MAIATAERSLALGRSRAEQGASLRGQDLERTFGDPFQFLAERIGEQAATAFCILFSAASINTALRILDWWHVYQTSPPSIAELLSGTVGEQNAEFEDMSPVSPRIQ